MTRELLFDISNRTEWALSLPCSRRLWAQVGHTVAQFVTDPFTITGPSKRLCKCCVELSNGCVSPAYLDDEARRVRTARQCVAGRSRVVPADVDGPRCPSPGRQ